MDSYVDFLQGKALCQSSPVRVACHIETFQILGTNVDSYLNLGIMLIR